MQIRSQWLLSRICVLQLTAALRFRIYQRVRLQTLLQRWLNLPFPAFSLPQYVQEIAAGASVKRLQQEVTRWYSCRSRRPS